MNTFERFYNVIRKIPRGRVATYGQVARLAGLPNHARHVGYALAASSVDNLPWHRVINSKGEVSPRSFPLDAERQRALLKKEGIACNDRLQISLSRYQWNPKSLSSQGTHVL